MDSTHKGPVTWKKFPFHVVFMLCLFLFRKWFCKELILKSMDDNGRKTYHNDYVTKLTLTRSVDQYPGNPFVTLRAHPLHPAGGSQLFCTYGVIALRKRPRREQRKTAGCRSPDFYRALFVWWRLCNAYIVCNNAYATMVLFKVCRRSQQYGWSTKVRDAYMRQ